MSTSQEGKPLQQEVPSTTRTESPGVRPAQDRKDRPILNLGQAAELDETVTARLKTESAQPEPPRSASPRPRPKTDTVNIPNAGRLVAERMARQASVLVEGRADYRLWLQSKSREELIEILVGLDDQQIDPESTQEIASIRSAQPADSNPQGYQLPDDMGFIRLPNVRTTPIDQPTPAWWIALINLEQTEKPLGLIVEGEITIGRAGIEATPDLDLSGFDAKRKGVSRLHDG
jgi:hypothetical protein